MFYWLKQSRAIYILSNLFVLPAIFLPFIDLLSNISFLIGFILLLKKNILLSLALSVLIIIKNNSSYRFNLLLMQKGKELSKSDYECVYLFAWCTFLRYLLIGFAVNQIFLFFT